MTAENANSLLDLARLLVVPFFAWAAYTDVRTRRIPNRVWPPLFVGGVVLFALTVQRALAAGYPYASNALPAAVVSLGVVAPVAYLFWLFGGFGGADAKALLVLSLLFPIYPFYEVAGVVLPLPGNENPLGSFAFTILTNTVLAGILYPLGLFARNALNGEFALPMFLGTRVDVDSVDDRYGTLMNRNDGMQGGSLDLDALRMYLRWRGESLSSVRERADALRDPASLPDDPNDPGDGNLDAHAPVDEATVEGSNPDTASSDDATEVGDAAHDGSDGETERGDVTDSDVSDGDASGDENGSGDASDDAPEADGLEDAWGAEAFLDDIDGDAYGTSPESLRAGLDVLARSGQVWVSPGIPFIVPMFVGLVLALTVGDLVTAAISLL
ncbi:prepilin peptidase [Halorubellus sp. PRR65]|uniref:A24 family peptidase n=1 Tax=Halorubellus sp. PRR65 TaxID=3098148 RepID=UPI002B26114A|nr:prepilin peptidase [Halorubellus sp. PRR65]